MLKMTGGGSQKEKVKSGRFKSVTQHQNVEEYNCYWSYL